MPSVLRGPIAKQFGLRLKTLRLSAGLTQKEAARITSKIGIITWHRLESGKQNSLNLELMDGIARLATQQGIFLPWLFGGQGPMCAEWPESLRIKRARAIVISAESKKARGRAG